MIIQLSREKRKEKKKGESKRGNFPRRIGFHEFRIRFIKVFFFILNSCIFGRKVQEI